ncbi:MAG TPA: hypothetical protein VF158_15915 [Longimicrobiales bacterium]
MLDITLDTNATAVEGWVRAIFHDQLPFATSRAINATAFDARDAIRAGVRDRFTIRRRWVVNGIQIPKGGRATKQKLEAVVELERRRAFLAKFEEGGTKRGTPTMPIAIPTEHIRPTPEKIPPLALYPKNLRLQERRDVSGMLAARTTLTGRGVVQLKGKRRTFVIDPQHHRADPELWGVWQRFGPRRHQIRLIWAYRRSIPIPATLSFVETGERTVRERWDHNFTRAFDRAIRTAR